VVVQTRRNEKIRQSDRRMTVIRAHWEAEIGRIVVQGQLGQISSGDPITTNSWAWWSC
jgi:hypothetical protein